MFMRYCIAWNIFAFLLRSAANELYHETAKLIQEMTEKDMFQKYLRPNHEGDPVNVSIYLAVSHIAEVNEVNEEFSLDAFLLQTWKDPRLNHSAPIPITLPGSSRDLIWTPDTFFLDIRSAEFHHVTSQNSRITITSEGMITFSARITVTARCAMDLTDYPLDEQACDLKMSSYAYKSYEVNYSWNEELHGNVVHVADAKLAQHTLIKTETLKMVKKEHHTAFSTLIARFWFKRRLGFVMFQMYLPIILLVTLSWLSFWIPQDAVPARVSLGSTTLLSVVTFIGSFKSSLPKVSYIKAVDVYFIVCFVFVFSTILEYILILLRTEFKLSLQKMVQSDGKEKGNVEEYAKEELELQVVKVESPVPASSCHRRRVAPKPISAAKKYVGYALIWNEADIVDKASRLLFPCNFIIFNLIYWMYYEWESFGHFHADT